MRIVIFLIICIEIWLEFVFEWFKHNGMILSRNYENVIRGEDTFQFLFIYQKT